MMATDKAMPSDQGDSSRAFPSCHETEPLFALSAVRVLGLDSRHHKSNVIDYLTYQVAREPVDLRCHVQRIGLLVSKGDGPGVYGALVDLFIGLGEKGLALRRRMLRTAKPLLSNDQSRALEEKLWSGLSALDRIPLSRASILAKNIRGSTELVGLDDTQHTASHDLLDEARSHLEYGQLEDARRVLEEAMLQDPLREDVQSELLEIYVRSNDQSLLSSMIQALHFTGNPVPPAWQRHLADTD
jgi:hypothetical protein